MMRRAWLAVLWLAVPATGAAHDGPPFPIVSDQPAGPYIISVWTDPDTTDDRTPGGQFWVMLAPARDGAPLPPATRARVVTRPIERPGSEESASTEPVSGDAGTQFAAVVMDHEGRFGVRVEVTGPLGAATVDSEVEATYDLRPPPLMMVLYLMPFLVVAAIWFRVLLRRRGSPSGRTGAGHAQGATAPPP